MTRRNRVLPDGQLVAAGERGTLWGNRGALLDSRGNLARYSRGRAWISCVLEYKGRRRSLAVPGRLTELFFLDEATALAAGHRPCGECRMPAYRAFLAAWTTAHAGARPGAPAMDAVLQRDRLAAPGVRRTYTEHLDRLPVGTVVETVVEREPGWCLVLDDELVTWHLGGYGQRRPRAGIAEVTVVTPRSIAATLQAGYRPLLHPSVRA